MDTALFRTYARERFDVAVREGERGLGWDVLLLGAFQESCNLGASGKTLHSVLRGSQGGGGGG